MNDHYNTAIPPITYINANGLPFCEGNVVKYITRYKRKGGYDDLVKCLHYVLLTMEREYGTLGQETIDGILETLKDHAHDEAGSDLPVDRRQVRL